MKKQEQDIMKNKNKVVRRNNIYDKDEKFQLSTLGKMLIFLGPFMIGLIIFTIYPFINACLMSVKENYSVLKDTFDQFGIANYEKIFGDKQFKTAIVNTAKYVAIVVPISMALSIVVAVLLNNTKRFKGLLQTAYFLPLVTSTAAISLVFKFMFQNKYGLINQILIALGSKSINFLGSKVWSKLVIYVFGIWNAMPLTIILLLAGLQNIDPQYYTAAKVDGAKPMDIFFNITIPLLAPTIFLTLIVNSISAFKVFDIIFQLIGDTTNAKALGSFTLIYYIYAKMAEFKYGQASAAAMILLLIISIFTFLQNWVKKKTSFID